MIRTPITNLQRTPIVGIQRIPITTGASVEPTKELEWDDIYNKLVNYIKFASKQVYEQYMINASNSAEDLFQEGQLLLYRCYTVYKHKDMNEFSALFKASLWRKLREIGSKKSVIQVDIDEAYDIGRPDNVLDEMFGEEKLQKVANILKNSPIALTIMKEFINPSTRTIWEAEMDIARKETLREQNYSISIPKSVQIKGVHIQRALEIPKSRFNEEFKLVKSVISSIYLQDDELQENCG